MKKEWRSLIIWQKIISLNSNIILTVFGCFFLVTDDNTEYVKKKSQVYKKKLCLRGEKAITLMDFIWK